MNCAPCDSAEPSGGWLGRSLLAVRGCERAAAAASPPPPPPPGRRGREFTPAERKDSLYWERRRRNNEAARRSRQKRRHRDLAVEGRLAALLADNARLRAQLLALRFPLGLLAEPCGRWGEAGEPPPPAPPPPAARRLQPFPGHQPRLSPAPVSPAPLPAPQPGSGQEQKQPEPTLGERGSPRAGVPGWFRSLPHKLRLKISCGGPATATNLWRPEPRAQPPPPDSSRSPGLPDEQPGPSPREEAAAGVYGENSQLRKDLSALSAEVELLKSLLLAKAAARRLEPTQLYT
uniref:transcription factor atf-2-like n=1 Tax=Pristiophorus japonicus TaxID=55135 RepID=UPI00398F7142